ncbi:MAG: VOC family protein [Sphingomonadales bacterium]
MSLTKILGLDHVGIRVSDFETANSFYQRLGFSNFEIDDDGDYELWTDGGLRVNLIPNAKSPEDGHNILLDEPVKYPGYTHAAFIIEDMDSAIENFKAAGINITGGPKESPRRRYFFIRDLDGNVLEFNQLKS